MLLMPEVLTVCDRRLRTRLMLSLDSVAPRFKIELVIMIVSQNRVS